MESKIKTYEDASAVMNTDPNALPDVSMLPEKHQKAVIAFCKLIVITAAINKKQDPNNQEWEPDWNDINQYKYMTWHEVEASEEQPAGFGFSLSYYDFTLSTSYVGSRLYYRSSEAAIYSAEQFKAEWMDFKLMN